MKTKLLSTLSKLTIAVAAAALLTSRPARADTYLLGKVSVTKPVIGAMLRIYDPQHHLVQTIHHATNQYGVFETHLTRDLSDFTIEASGGTLGAAPFQGTLRANVTDHNTAFAAPVFVNGETTLASTLKEKGIPADMKLHFEVDPDFKGLPGSKGPAEDIMMSLAKSAASKVGGEAAGWVMNILLGSSKSDKTAEELAEIKSELRQQTQMLYAISSKLDALSAALDKAIDRVIDEVKQTGYEGRVQQLDAPMAKIKAAFDTLVLYTQADPKVDRTHEIEKLRDYIKIEIVAALFQIHDSLVGTPTVTGLIPTWSQISAKKVRGFPTFLTNDYLRPVNLQADYYRYWEIIAGTLIIEAYHAENTVPDPKVGQHYYDLLKSKLDEQRKFIPGAELGSDDTIVDTRTKLMWMRSMHLEPVAKSVIWYFPYAVKYLSNLRLGGYTDWKTPTLEQWESLAKGTNRVADTMIARGWNGIEDTWALLPGNCVFNMYEKKAKCDLNPQLSAAAPFAVRAWTPFP